MKKHFGFAAILVGLICSNGCSLLRTDLVAKKRVTVVLGTSDVVEFSSPSVILRRGELYVSGSIGRKPGVKTPIPGHIVITVNSGETDAELAKFTTLWTPSSIPLSGSRQSTFTARYGWVPDEGSVIKIAYEKNDSDLPALSGTSSNPDAVQVGPLNAPLTGEKSTPNTGTPNGNNTSGVTPRRW